MMLYFFSGVPRVKISQPSPHKDEDGAKDASLVCLLSLRSRSHLGPGGNYFSVVSNDMIRSQEGSAECKGRHC